MMTNHRSSVKRRGFTLLELVVATSIIGLLTALLLPAVMSAREASRRSGCRNNLRQIGIAQHNYEATHGVLPGLSWQHIDSIFILTLPYLDQAPLYDAWTGRGAYTATMNVPVFVCPSETIYVDEWPAGFVPAFIEGPGQYPSYAVNEDEATGLMPNGRIEQFGLRGFSKVPVTRARDVTDGLSNTAALAERLVVTNSMMYTGVPDDDRRMWLTPTARFAAPELDQFADECLHEHFAGPDAPWSGVGYDARVMNSNFGYNHILPPNSPSCFNGPDARLGVMFAARTASSLHPGGVHVLLADGSVRFVVDGIDRYVWRAIGTRDAGDVVTTF